MGASTLRVAVSTMSRVSTKTTKSPTSPHGWKYDAKARAAGIYLVFAAQRPEASVMPPFMRSNFGIRLVLKVADRGTSNIALGDANSFAQANELLGKGHMIAVLSEKTVFCQVPNVEE